MLIRAIAITAIASFSSNNPVQAQDPVTIEDLGGWDKIQQQFFDDGAGFDQMISRINQK
jgi:sulfate/thiosulfate transport system substrate-binding protein